MASRSIVRARLASRRTGFPYSNSATTPKDRTGTSAPDASNDGATASIIRVRWNTAIAIFDFVGGGGQIRFETTRAKRAQLSSVSLKSGDPSASGCCSPPVRGWLSLSWLLLLAELLFGAVNQLFKRAIGDQTEPG